MPPMPPKPAPESEEDFSDEDDENESESDSEDTDSSEEDTTTTESSEEEEEFSAAKKGPTNATAVIKNKPHDEEFHVTNSSAPAGAAPAKQPATKQPAPAAAQQPGRGPAAGHSVVQNRAHDEEFQVESAPSGNNKAAPKPAAKAAQPTNTGGASSGKLTNTHMDEFEDVENDVPDSPKKAPAQAAAAKQQTQQPVRAAPSGVGEREIKNNKADLEFVVNPNAKSGAGLAVPAPGKMTTMKPPTPSDSSASSGSDRDTDEEDEESHHNSSAHNQRRNDTKQVGAVDTSLLSSNMSSGPTVTTGATSGLEYNPNDYLHVTQSVPADVRDIFAYITAYSATAMECPAKLRPFIPDYIPSVGDIDTFCKVPRPDDKPDQYGLAVVDEPSSRMSNPTIIKQILIQTETGTPVVSIEDQLMDSLRDASRKPEAIDKWIEDVRLVHGKKAAPTVYYSKPMPSIDSLMQAWPPGFEDVLNSDLQLPPPNIDLDMEQYVRMLCAILDIPVHTNLVESLHVMFTLYLEFRENQHFKAA